MTDQKSSTGLLKEPLFHFFVLALLLFVVDYLFSVTQKEQIIVDEQASEYLIQQREDLELRTLTAEEREETILSYVEDEILYSEAYKRGLDRGDSRMRRNMILKMRGLLTGELDEPTEDQLRAYYDSNPERFTRPATVTFDHVYFSDPSAASDITLEELRSGADPRQIGEDNFNMPRRMPGMSQAYIVGTFGPDVARQILEIDDGEWHGPFESIHGAHFVRITERIPERIDSFEDVSRYLADYWILDEGRRRIEAEVESLWDDYDVIIEPYGDEAE